MSDMSSPPLAAASKMVGFSTIPKRNDKAMEPLVNLHRLTKQLDGFASAAPDQTWMIRELRAMLKTIQNSVDLLKPLTKDWAAVTDELKEIVSIVSNLVKRLVGSFENHLVSAESMTSYINSAAFITDFNFSMVNTRALQAFLLRFGINGGLVSEIGCAQYTLPNTAWRYPVAYLPDRNLLFAPRNAEMKRFEQIFVPLPILSYKCIHATNGISGVGITETLAEHCYRSIEDGVVGVVAWISGRTMSSIIHSFRSFAKRIRLSDKTFCKSVELIDDMDQASLVQNVIDWFQKLSYPWIVVFDGVLDSYNIHRDMVPQFGCGSVIFSTQSSCVPGLKEYCATVPQVIEFKLLDHEEKLSIASSLVNYAGPFFDDDEIAELVKCFGGHPLELIEACRIITTRNNRLQEKIDTFQYLDKLRLVEARGMENRELLIYQTLNVALDVAIRLPGASTMGIAALLDLLPYVDGQGVDARLALKWLLSGAETLMLAVTDEDLRMDGDDVAVINEGSLLTVTVTSVIPHDLHSNGGTHHTWKIRKTFVELQTFFDDMKKASAVLSKVRFPGKPHHRANLKPTFEVIKVPLRDMNFALQKLCSDRTWKISCLDPDVKSFIGILSNEDVYADAGSRVIAIIDPLISLGIVRMKHRFGLIDAKEQCVSFSVCGDFQTAMSGLVQQEDREETAVDDVHSFFLDCLDEINGNVNNKLSAELILPHVLRVLTFPRYTKSSLNLVTVGFLLAKSHKLLSEQAALALAGMEMLRNGPYGKKGSNEELEWGIRYARSVMSLGAYVKAVGILTSLLDLSTQLNAKHDVAVIEGLLAEVSEKGKQYSEAENHLVKSLEAWQLCFHEDKQKDVANCLQKLARLHRMTGKTDRSLEFDIMAIDLLKSIYGPSSSVVLDAQINFAFVLIGMNKFDNAISTCVQVLQTYDADGGAIDVSSALTSLKLAHPSAPSVCVMISNCYVAKKMFSEAEILLNHCLDSLFTLHRDRPHESVALILATLGGVQTDKGDNESALKSFKDSLDILRCIYDASDLRIAQALNKVGNHLKLMGKYAFAEGYFKGAVEIFDKKPCLESARTVISLADMLLSQDRGEEALALTTKAVAVYRLIDTTDLPVLHDFCAALTFRADLFTDQGMLDSALEQLDEVQEILNNTAVRNDAAIAEIYEKMAEIYRLKKMDDEVSRWEGLANAIYEKNGGMSEKKFLMPRGGSTVSTAFAREAQAVTLVPSADTADVDDQANLELHRAESTELLNKREEEDQLFLRMQEELISKLVVKYGEKHQRVASALNNLAHLLVSKERFEEALRMLVASLEILLELYGETHAHVATVYQNMGHVYQRSGKYEEAESLFQQALVVRRAISGDVSAHVAQSLNSLGLVLRAQGKYLDAKLCMEESLAIRRVLYGHSHFSIAVALNNLGMLQKSLWLYKEAEISLRDGLAIRKATFEENHPSIAISMMNLGSLLVSMGKFSEARKLFEQTLETQKKAYGKKRHPDIEKTMTYLAELNIQENKLISAKTVLEEIIRVRSEIHGAENEDFYTNISRLSRLYHAMNLTEDAEKLDSILAERTTQNIKPKFDDKFVMLPEIEEDDKIVSRLMSFGSFNEGSGGENKPNEFRMDLPRSDTIAADIEEIPRWLAAINEVLSRLYRSKRDEVQSATDVKRAIKATFEEAKADLQGLRDALEENKVKIRKLEVLAVENSKYEREIIDVQYDSAHIEKEMETAVLRKNELESELEHAADIKAKAKKFLHKLESAMPKFETLRATISGSISRIGEKEELANQKKEKVLQLTESFSAAEGDTIDHRSELQVFEHNKVELESDLRAEYDDQSKNVDDLHRLCLEFEIDVKPPIARRRSANTVKGRKSRSRVESNSIDDNTSIDSFDSREDTDDEHGHYKTSKSTHKLKKKIRQQTMMIDMLRSQLLGLGVRPIEEVVTFEQAEIRLKDALQRLLEGNEAAAAEFERWDEYVRNHPEYKRRELERVAIWQSENMPLNVFAMRNIKSFIPVDIYNCTKDFLYSTLPRALARRVWDEKALWLLRTDPRKIAKLHIADLQSKYSTQSLDEVELRAVLWALPEKFENDATGEKANWRAAILQRLQSKRTHLPWSGSGEEPPDEVVEIFLKSITRNGAYRNAAEVGPFDPDALPTAFDHAGAVFTEPEKYNPSCVHSDTAPISSFSILETVQSMHTKMDRRKERSPRRGDAVALTEEEDIARKERRRASLIRLRNQKASIDDVEASVLHNEEDPIDDSFDMFPSRSRKIETPHKNAPMMDGLQEAVLKRRALLESSSPSNRSLNWTETSAPDRGIARSDSSNRGLIKGDSFNRNLEKGESFRAAPDRAKGESFRAPVGAASKAPSRLAFMLGSTAQKPILLTGPHQVNATDEDSSLKTSSAKQTILHKIFFKKDSGDGHSIPLPPASPRSPAKQKSLKTAPTLFSLTEE